MKPLIDLHTHTIASGHAYSTLKENIESAEAVGLKIFGTSDHAEMMPGSCNNFFFGNYKVIPRQYKDMRILCGIEANIMDFEGNIDVSEATAKKVDYIIASLHPYACIKPGTVEQNTAAVLGVMDNPYVKIIGHPDDDRIPVDLDVIVPAAAEKNMALELNNSSLNPGSSRVGSDKNIRKMLNLAKKYGTYIILGTDSHICLDIGRFDDALKVLCEENFPEELVINFDLDKIDMVINK